MKRYTINRFRDKIQSTNDGFYHYRIPVRVYVVKDGKQYHVGWENLGKDNLETYNLTSGTARECGLAVHEFYYNTCERFLQNPCEIRGKKLTLNGIENFSYHLHQTSHDILRDISDTNTLYIDYQLADSAVYRYYTLTFDWYNFMNDTVDYIISKKLSYMSGLIQFQDEFKNDTGFNIRFNAGQLKYIERKYNEQAAIRKTIVG